MNDIQNKIKNTIRRAVISRHGDDSGTYHITQITYNKKTVPAEVINPYGLYTNPPDDLQTLVFTICGDSENRAIIAYSQDDRFKDLKEGEVVVGNPKTGTFIKLKEDGGIEIDSKSEINITVNGNVKVKAINVELDALVAVKEIERRQGGLAVAVGGKVSGSLALPVAGLLSDEPLEVVVAKLEKLEKLARDLGTALPSPFATLSFLALPVIPELRLTDLGLVDVNAFKLVK